MGGLLGNHRLVVDPEAAEFFLFDHGRLVLVI